MKLTPGEYDHVTVSQSVRRTYKLRTACMEMKRAGTLNVSKKTSAAFSLFLLGLSGASVSRTGCYQTQRCTQIRINEIRPAGCLTFIVFQQEERRSSPPRRKSAAAPWSKRTARSSPCRSSPSRSRAPSGIAPTTSPGAPDHHRQAIKTRDVRVQAKICLSISHSSLLLGVSSLPHKAQRTDTVTQCHMLQKLHDDERKCNKV